MRLHRPQKFRRLLPTACRYCDRQFFYKPGGRPRLFCDHTCQQRDFRRLKGGTSGRDESRGKNQIGSTISKVDFGNRPSVLIGSFSPEQQRRFAELLAQIPDDLSIPAFMQRGRP
jgi:hypothetical protein